MKFIDEAVIKVFAGHGGPGASTFRREKYVALGGPNGGDGGNGGDIVLQASENVNTLYDIRLKREVKAESGLKGLGNQMYGRGGKDETITLPVGTFVYDSETGELLADLNHHGQKEVIAKGGLGGKGNVKFKTSTNKAPTYSQPGCPGESKIIRLELKLIADIGILGFPSVGKSTFISVVSNAKPKIADYPFTTLTPNLGMVENKNFTSYVIADIPGIIEGASDGAGLGQRFLKHVERTKFLLHMVEITPARKSPVEDIKILNKELENFSDSMLDKEQIYVLNKCDVYSEEDKETIEQLEKFLDGKKLFKISAITRKGLPELMNFLGEKVISYSENH